MPQLDANSADESSEGRHRDDGAHAERADIKESGAARRQRQRRQDAEKV